MLLSFKYFFQNSKFRDDRKKLCRSLLSSIFIYLFLAALGFCCGTQDLSLRCMGASLRHVGFSLIVACGLSSCSAQSQLPRGIWDLSSPNRNRTCVPCIKRCILNHSTTREVPMQIISALIFVFLYLSSNIVLYVIFLYK